MSRRPPTTRTASQRGKTLVWHSKVACVRTYRSGAASEVGAPFPPIQFPSAEEGLVTAEPPISPLLVTGRRGPSSYPDCSCGDYSAPKERSNLGPQTVQSLLVTNIKMLEQVALLIYLSSPLWTVSMHKCFEIFTQYLFEGAMALLRSYRVHWDHFLRSWMEVNPGTRSNS